MHDVFMGGRVDLLMSEGYKKDVSRLFSRARREGRACVGVDCVTYLPRPTYLPS